MHWIETNLFFYEFWDDLAHENDKNGWKKCNVKLLFDGNFLIFENVALGEWETETNTESETGQNAAFLPDTFDELQIDLNVDAFNLEFSSCHGVYDRQNRFMRQHLALKAEQNCH